MSNGYFITFEGIDGTGKSTQLSMLEQKIRETDKRTVVVTKEPGSPADTTGLGREIRQILFHSVTTNAMATGVATCLLLADHIQHVEKVVRPALAEGKIVLSDRYADSEFAYAAATRPPACLLDAYTTLYGPIPDITVLFVATDPATMLERARNRRGETHQAGKAWDDLQMQRAIQNAYLDRLVGQTRTIILAVPPEETQGQVFERLWNAVSFAMQRVPAELTD